MDVKFENCYTITKERYMDWIKHPIKKQYYFLLWALLMAVSILMLIISILDFEMIFSVIYFLFTLFFIYRIFFRTRLLSARAFKIISVNHGCNQWERCIQFSDNITVIDGNVTTLYHWCQVKKLQDNKVYFILVFQNNTGIRLDKQCFTKGNYEEFVEYAKHQTH